MYLYTVYRYTKLHTYQISNDDVYSTRHHLKNVFKVSFLRKLKKKKEIDFMDCLLDFWHRTIREGLVLRCFCRSYCFRGPPKTIVNFCETRSN